MEPEQKAGPAEKEDRVCRKGRKARGREKTVDGGTIPDRREGACILP